MNEAKQKKLTMLVHLVLLVSRLAQTLFCLPVARFIHLFSSLIFSDAGPYSLIPFSTFTVIQVQAGIPNIRSGK